MIPTINKIRKTQQFLSYDPGTGSSDDQKDKEDVPSEFTQIPSDYEGNMINVNGIMYKWNPDTKKYDLAEGDPSTLGDDSGTPGGTDTGQQTGIQTDTSSGWGGTYG